MPAAVATSASEIAGAITERDEFAPLPSPAKVSRIETTVPKSPIKGEVEAITESHAKPLVALLCASERQILSLLAQTLWPDSTHLARTEPEAGRVDPITRLSSESLSSICHADRPVALESNMVKLKIKYKESQPKTTIPTKLLLEK